MLFPFFWLRSTGFPFDWLERLALPASPEGQAAQDGEAAYQAHVADARRALAQLLADPLAAEAVFLSNPESLERLIALRDSDLDRVDARARQRLRLAWSYLQRFCAKNDTNSFFGPIAWGRVDAAAPEPVRLETTDPAAGWLRRRRVNVEHWVVDRLCTAISEHPELRRTLPLRFNPGCDLDGGVLRYPVGKRAQLGAEAREFMCAVLDGKREAAALAATPGAARLLSARVVGPELAVAPGVEQPLRRIEEALPSAGDAAGESLQRLVPELETMRGRFERAGLEERQDLLRRMSEALAAAGISTERARGEMYVGRFPVYEDCERNLSVGIGGSLAQLLEERLAPVMRLFRVAAECAAARLDRHYAQILESLPAEAGGFGDFLVFLRAARTEEAGRVRTDIAAEMRATLEQAWASHACADGTEQSDVSAADLEGIAEALRAATPGHGQFAGVLGVGIASPDIMLAARGLDALRRGEYRVVLGEVHPCVATALQPVALPFLDSSEDALRLADRLLAPGRMLLASSSRAYHRSQIDWPCVSNLHEIVLPGATSRCPPERQIPAGRGRLAGGGPIRFVDRATGRSEDLVTVLSTDLHRMMFSLARDVLGACLPQRLVHREIVLKRRSWSYDAARLPAPPRPAESLVDYLALRRWARAQALPRHVFLSAEDEPKPLYVDWDNPLAVDLFAKTIQRSPRIRLSEMSPAPEELWMTDARGRYCCELRMSLAV